MWSGLKSDSQNTVVPHVGQKMHPELSSLLPIADIDFGRSFGANMFPLEKRTDADHRARPPLTLATMADAYDIGLGGCLDTQAPQQQSAVLVIVPLHRQVR